MSRVLLFGSPAESVEQIFGLGRGALSGTGTRDHEGKEQGRAANGKTPRAAPRRRGLEEGGVLQLKYVPENYIWGELTFNYQFIGPFSPPTPGADVSNKGLTRYSSLKWGVYFGRKRAKSRQIGPNLPIFCQKRRQNGAENRGL